MADLYALEFVGGPDATQNPPRKLDHRLVGGKKRRTRATKPAVQLNVGDRLYLGKLPANALLTFITVNTDTSFGSSTLSIGTTAVPAKYVNARTLTATDTPTAIGPRAAAAVLAPSTTDEAIWLTVGGAAIPAGVVAALAWEYTITT
ncbi:MULTISPECIES: hypothetical protein [unclassified Sphingomonas]|uniref:hypothetical protein n=1 Tax=unclassified Sphingomonas TaxID=196159 RepID=UPI0006F3ABF7|nr:MULTISPECIES: hypothetical protein [unclassified Sphingomonas]KQM60064.1 hypothetical protein ASE65_10180 [Sphingomonas sp. Leaf16]KQN11462.1 hypothetical protein ASE81_11165 [Sphingomonas sp. Leaf29]KQN18784.1 hypothetical protein ASE83_11105 [Sphingomonas sp. Leaf32]